MKPKSLVLLSTLFALGVGALAGCGGGGKSSITIWVGNESTEFYRAYANKWVEAQAGNLPYNIEVIGTDVGSNGGAMLSDNTACGDIVTIAHDNIGKLSQQSYILPIMEQGLLDQIKADNPEAFLNVIQNYLGSDKTNKYYFMAPCISQALFLYYDTRAVTAEQSQSIEGLMEAAKAKSCKAMTCLGTDGFNFSFSLLARKVDGNTSDTVIYQDLDYKKAYAQSNEQVAIVRTMQELFADPNGIKFPSDSGWAVDLQGGDVLSLVGGAWNYKAVKKALTDDSGDVHMGCTLIPTFGLSATACEGINATTNLFTGKADPAPVAGTRYRGGTFADCKGMVINAACADDKLPYVINLVKYLTSIDAQKQSFVEAGNVPAFKGAAEYIETVKDTIEDTLYLMAKAQTAMNEFGIAQPFVDARMNNYYYQDKAPDYYRDAMLNKEVDGQKEYGTVELVRKLLFRMEYIWKHGGDPATYPDTYPSDTTEKR